MVLYYYGTLRKWVSMISHLRTKPRTFSLTRGRLTSRPINRNSTVLIYGFNYSLYYATFINCLWWTVVSHLTSIELHWSSLIIRIQRVTSWSWSPVTTWLSLVYMRYWMFIVINSRLYVFNCMMSVHIKD